MSDDEVVKFEITDYDIDNEFNMFRPRRNLSKNQQIYGKFKLNCCTLRTKLKCLYLFKVFGRTIVTMKTDKALQNLTEKYRKIIPLLLDLWLVVFNSLEKRKSVLRKKKILINQMMKTVKLTFKFF